MMRIFGHILMILIAAFVVIGAVYAVSQTTAAQALIGQPLGGGEAEDRPARPDFASGQSNLPGEMRGRPAEGLEGHGGQFETVGRNLLYIAVIVAAVQVLWSIGRRLKLAAALVQKDRLAPQRND